MGRENSINFITMCKIEEALDNTPLSHMNFEISSKDDLPVLIILKGSPGYYFRVTRPNNFQCEMEPGETQALDRVGFGRILDCLPAIEQWARNVAAELRARHQRIERDEFVRKWDELTNTKYEDPQKPLDSDDFDRWKQIVKDLRSRVEELEKKGQVPKEEVADVIREGKEIEEQAGAIPGRNWMLIGGKFILRLLRYASLDPTIRHTLFTHVNAAVKELPQHIDAARQLVDGILH